MSLIGPFIQSLIEPLTGSLTSSITGVGAITRLFATFDGTDDFISIPAVTAAGDFELSVDFSTTVSGTIMTIVSGASSVDGILIDFTATLIRCFAFVGGSLQTIISTSSTPYVDGKLHTVTLTHTGTTAEMLIDGVSINTATWALDGWCR